MNPNTSQVVLLIVICKPADWARGARHWSPEHQIPQPVCQKVAPENKKLERKTNNSERPVDALAVKKISITD